MKDLVRLIINADDFGLTQGVNRGIIKAHTQGQLSSATLMANGLAWQEAVDLAKAHPRLGVGAHLTLTALKPVLPREEVPSLVDSEGRFRKQLWRLPLYNLGEVRAEWKAQIQRLLQAGLKLTHLDSHHHSHLWPSLAKLVWELARENEIPAVRLISPPSLERMGVTGLAALVAKRTWSHLRGQVPSPATVTGIEAFPLTRAGLERHLEGLEPGIHELFCHPGSAGDDDLAKVSSLREQRGRELDTLCSPWFGEVLNQLGVELVSYSVFSEEEKP